MKHAELKRLALQQPTAQAAYDALAAEFTLLRQMLQARADAGLTQEQVAARMGTKGPAIARLESSLSSGKHSPSLATLRRYAAAVGRRGRPAHRSRGPREGRYAPRASQARRTCSHERVPDWRHCSRKRGMGSCAAVSRTSRSTACQPVPPWQWIWRTVREATMR